MQKLRKLVEASSIFRVLGGFMKSSIQCLKCHRKSQITEHFYDMNLECQKSNSVSESLESFFRVDKLSGKNKYRCEHCKSLQNADKRFLFHRLPEVLTLQLKRFTNSLSKINKFVKYEPILNVGLYTQNSDKLVLFELFGVVVHAGSSSYSGHYYSYVKEDSGAWFKMDDSWVSKSDINAALNQRAYLLFYRRKGAPEVDTSTRKPEPTRELNSTTASNSPTNEPKHPEVLPKKSNAANQQNASSKQLKKSTFAEQLHQAIYKYSDRIKLIQDHVNAQDLNQQISSLKHQKQATVRPQSDQNDASDDSESSDDSDFEVEGKSDKAHHELSGEDQTQEWKPDNCRLMISRRNRVPYRLKQLAILRKLDKVVKRKKKTIS